LIIIKNKLHLYIYNLLKKISDWYLWIDRYSVYPDEPLIKADYEFIFVAITCSGKLDTQDLLKLEQLLNKKLIIEPLDSKIFITIEIFNGFSDKNEHKNI